VFFLLVVALLGCKSSRRHSIQQAYEDCRLKMNRGELQEARAEAESGLRRFPTEDTTWHWRFTVLKAEILVRQRFNKEALALLEPELPALLRSSELAVWRKLTQGMARAFVSVGCFHVIGFRLAGDLVDLQRRKNYSAKETVRVGRLTSNVEEYWPGLILVSPPARISLRWLKRGSAGEKRRAGNMPAY